MLRPVLLAGLNGGDGGPGLACRPAIRKVKQRKKSKKKKKEDKQREKWRAGPGLPSCLGGPWPEVNPDYAYLLAYIFLYIFLTND